MKNEEMAEGVSVSTLKQSEFEATKEMPRSIIPINADTVQKICSGQVVLSLAVAVKELIENAIDANATLIEIKLHERGLESIEVSDNGSGVTESNLESMTANHHTSKLKEFYGLLDVETFGFRGEALSSLCALSSMTIVTRHKFSDVASKIHLDHNGKIINRSSCSRSIGTTVILKQLFQTLPVRRREFIRNIKQEFTRLCNMVQTYCLVVKGVRLICTNQNVKGVKTVVLQSHGAMDILANISAVFGVKQSNELLTIKPAFDNLHTLTNETILAELSNFDNKFDTFQLNIEDMECLKSSEVQFEGYISNWSHGFGRSSKDRQFFYINSRPCDSKNLSKVVNDVYHYYNVNQYPFVYLNIIIKRSYVDVNVTPDKRVLLINNEKLILMLLKKSLLNTFGNVPAKYKLDSISAGSIFKTEAKTKMLNVKDDDASNQEDMLVSISKANKCMNVLSQWQRKGDVVVSPHLTPVTSSKRKCVSEIEECNIKIQKLKDYSPQQITKNASTHFVSCKPDPEDDNTKAKSPDQTYLHVEKINKEDQESDLIISASINQRFNCDVSKSSESNIQKSTALQISAKIHPKENNIINPYSKIKYEHEEAEKLCSLKTIVLKQNPENSTYISHTLKNEQTESGFEDKNNFKEIFPKIIILDEPNEDPKQIMENLSDILMKTSIDEIAALMQADNKCKEKRLSRKNMKRLRFKSEISPNENEKAEEELKTEISNTDFACMEIIGQFNLGFIIVKLSDDLFIVDQHASDEKYNFEKLQEITVIPSQHLVVPQQLELTVVKEMVLLDHLHVFERNGFRFEINENAAPMRKVRLVAKPVSKNWEFGREDIDELLFMLQDAPAGTICRPSRMRAMFASRACRKSIMIGKRLQYADMRKVIAHMGEIEQPWNCPHGRPTIRYLINMTMVYKALTESLPSDASSKYQQLEALKMKYNRIRHL